MWPCKRGKKRERPWYERDWWIYVQVIGHMNPLKFHAKPMLGGRVQSPHAVVAHILCSGVWDGGRKYSPRHIAWAEVGEEIMGEET